MNIQKTLLLREFWEHKGGFFWAPLVACLAFLAITMGGMVTGSMIAHQAAERGEIVVEGQVITNSVDLGKLLAKVPEQEMAQVGQAIDVSLWIAAAWPFVVLGFVAFFYCLSCLYDERRDRSVLFWKSMPVSDNATVLSKALSALVVAPLIAALIGAMSMIVFYGMMSMWVFFHGANPVALLSGASPLKIAAQLLATLPVYALWALPTAGWLMLCSSVARSKPILWAILIPIMAGIAISMSDIMTLFGQDSAWFWKNVSLRALFGFVPGSWLGEVGSIRNFPFALSTTFSTLASPALWIGAVAGVGMMALSAYARRWKDEG